MSPYRLTSLAEEDLNSIIESIAAHNSSAAGRLLERFQARFEALAALPDSGRSREEFGVGIRSSVVGSHLTGRFARGSKSFGSRMVRETSPIFSAMDDATLRG